MTLPLFFQIPPLLSLDPISTHKEPCINTFLPRLLSPLHATEFLLFIKTSAWPFRFSDNEAFQYTGRAGELTGTTQDAFQQQRRPSHLRSYSILAMQTLDPPKNTRGGRGPRNHRDSRGRIEKPQRGAPRTDRDGDLEMDAAGGGGRGGSRGGNRGGGKGGGRGRPDVRERGQGSKSSENHGRGSDFTRKTKKPTDPTFIEKALRHGLSSGDVTVREGRPGFDYIAISGWKDSKASHNEDGGVQRLLEFLGTKATHSGQPPVIIKKVCLKSQSVDPKHLSNFALIGPLSCQANLPERRPRFLEVAAFAYG